MYHKSNADGVSIVVLIIIGIFLFVIVSIYSSVKYNNGICPHCGGHYVYQQAVGHYSSTDYIYICDQCGDLIKSSIYYGK